MSTFYQQNKDFYHNIKLCDQEGSGFKDDMKFFSDNFEKIKERLIGDTSLERAYEGMREKLISITPETEENVRKDVLDYFIKISPDKKSHIGWIIKTYLNNPEYLFEDLSKVENSLIKYRALVARKLITDEKDRYYLNIDAFKSFSEIDQFIERYETQLKEIEKKKESKDSQKNKQIKIKEEGDNPENLEIFMETNQVTVYHPKTEKGACFIGRNARWCTAGEKNNMFNQYNKHGPLYVIIPKEPSHFGEKYQVHFETEQYMDEHDKPINIPSLLIKFNSIENWLKPEAEKARLFNEEKRKKELIEKKRIEREQDVIKRQNDIEHARNVALSKRRNLDIAQSDMKNKLIAERDIKILKQIVTPQTTILKLSDTFNKYVDNLEYLKNLQELTFGREFNQNLRYVTFPASLRIIRFGRDFDQLIDNTTVFPDSLISIVFGEKFNQSLMGINFPTQLKNLSFGNQFNQEIEMNQLPTTLETLEFGDNFDQKLDDVVYGLDNLKELKVGKNFNKSLDLYYATGFQRLIITPNQKDLPNYPDFEIVTKN